MVPSNLLQLSMLARKHQAYDDDIVLCAMHHYQNQHKIFIFLYLHALLLYLCYNLFPLVADVPGLDMYYVTGRQPRTQLQTYRAKRGSSKNEAINKVAEISMKTTAQLREEAGHGELGTIYATSLATLQMQC